METNDHNRAPSVSLRTCEECVTALFQLLYCVRHWLHRYGRAVAYYNMLAWWRQRTEHEQVEWCNVVHDHGPITPEMADGRRLVQIRRLRPAERG